MSGGELGLGPRLVLTAGIAVVLVLFGLVMNGYRTPTRDPYLSSRGWVTLLGLGSLGLLGTVFTVPGSRSGIALHVGSYVPFGLALVLVARGIGRARLLAPALTGSPAAGRARAIEADEGVTAPFSGRSCLACGWRIERAVPDRTGDRNLFETVESGLAGRRFRVGERTVDPTGVTLLDADEATVPETEWADGALRAVTESVGLATGSDRRLRAIERRVDEDDRVTVLPGVVYCGDEAATRRALGRTVLSRVVAGGAVAVLAAGAIIATACLPG